MRAMNRLRGEVSRFVGKTQQRTGRATGDPALHDRGTARRFRGGLRGLTADLKSTFRRRRF